MINTPNVLKSIISHLRLLPNVNVMLVLKCMQMDIVLILTNVNRVEYALKSVQIQREATNAVVNLAMSLRAIASAEHKVIFI